MNAAELAARMLSPAESGGHGAEGTRVLAVDDDQNRCPSSWRCWNSLAHGRPRWTGSPSIGSAARDSTTYSECRHRTAGFWRLRDDSKNSEPIRPAGARHSCRCARAPKTACERWRVDFRCTSASRPIRRTGCRRSCICEKEQSIRHVDLHWLTASRYRRCRHHHVLASSDRTANSEVSARYMLRVVRNVCGIGGKRGAGTLCNGSAQFGIIDGGGLENRAGRSDRVSIFRL